LDGQDGGGQQASSESRADAVEATRTVRESAERAAAAAASTSGLTVGPPLTGSGINASHCMHRPEARRLAADQHQSNDEKDRVHSSPEADTAPEPEIARLSLNGGAEDRSPELTNEVHRGASATVADEEAPGPDITSSAPPPEVATRRPVAALDRKSACQEPVTERFDRIVRYFDSRQHVSGESGHHNSFI